MSRLADAMKQKFGTLEGVARAAGINTASPGSRTPTRDIAADDAHGLKIAAVSAAKLGENGMARPMRARRFGRDEEIDREELKELIDDKDADFGDILAAVITQAPDDAQEDVHEALRELSQDARGPRSWARDRLEVRRYGRDARRYNRDRRRYGKDNPADFEGMPKTGTEGEDRRRMAGDIAYDSDPRSEFEKMFGPGAASIGRGIP